MATFEQVFNQTLQEHIDNLEEGISSGIASDFADYKFVCGQLRGLRYAQIQFNDLLRKERDDDDE